MKLERMQKLAGLENKTTNDKSLFEEEFDAALKIKFSRKFENGMAKIENTLKELTKKSRELESLAYENAKDINQLKALFKDDEGRNQIFKELGYSSDFIERIEDNFKNLDSYFRYPSNVLREIDRVLEDVAKKSSETLKTFSASGGKISDNSHVSDFEDELLSIFGNAGKTGPERKALFSKYKKEITHLMQSGSKQQVDDFLKKVKAEVA